MTKHQSLPSVCLVLAFAIVSLTCSEKSCCSTQSRYPGSSLVTSTNLRPAYFPKFIRISSSWHTSLPAGSSHDGIRASRVGETIEFLELGREIRVALELPPQHFDGAHRVGDRAVGMLDFSPRVEVDRRRQIPAFAIVKDPEGVHNPAVRDRELDPRPAELCLQQWNVEAGDTETRQIRSRAGTRPPSTPSRQTLVARQRDRR